MLTILTYFSTLNKSPTSRGTPCWIQYISFLDIRLDKPNHIVFPSLGPLFISSKVAAFDSVGTNIQISITKLIIISK